MGIASCGMYDGVMTLCTRLVLCLSVILLAASFAWAQEAGPAPGLANSRKTFPPGEPILGPQDKAAIIRLDAPVDDMMLRSIKRRVNLAERMGCTVLVFEMETWGGLVTSGIDISKYIKELSDKKKFVTVAWVHNRAISAGAMISASCQYVVMHSHGSYGDCAPIAFARSLGGNELVALPPAERAKMEGPVVSEFEDSARRNNWNASLLHAMVVVEDQVHEVRRKGTNELVYVNTKVKDELLAVEDAAPDGKKAAVWEYVRTVDDDKQLLIVLADDARKMKLSDGTADDDTQLTGLLNIKGQVSRLHFNWAENATVFLTRTFIRFLLFVGLLVFAWLEFTHPGISIFGIAALICLVLLIGAPFLTGLAQVWEIALIVIGLAIIITDLIAFGGVGMLAVPGFILMAVGLVASFIPEGGAGFTTRASWQAATQGLGVLVGGTFVAVILFYLMSKYLAITPGFRHLQLVPGGGRGAAAAVVVRDAADREAGDAVFAGALGRAASDLRPAGKARFGEHLVDVISHGSYIEAGTEVVVTKVHGARVVVKPHA
jgi:membrane-bound serine protease (ClpP class)